VLQDDSSRIVTEKGVERTELPDQAEIRHSPEVGREVQPPGPSAESPTKTSDDVEAGLASALGLAATAGHFDIVAQLARELEARRLARTRNVVALDAGRVADKNERG
jgi:hypothetical protein